MLSAAHAAEDIDIDSAGWICWICPAPQGAVGLISQCLYSALGMHRAVLQLTVMSQSY